MSIRIMIICPSMWPNMRSWGETQRMYYLANYLANKQWKVSVVAPWYSESQNDEREILYEPVFLGKKYSQKSAESIQKKAGFFKKLRHRIARIFNAICEKVTGETPFVEVVQKKRWIAEYKDDICKMITQKQIDVVIISAPSFSLFSLSEEIKKRCGNVRIVFDYRDPWYLWKQNNLSYYIEKRCIKNADVVVGFSDAFIMDMKGKYGLNDIPTHTIYNGYSGQTWCKFYESRKNEDKKEKDKLVLTYTGMIHLSNQKNNYRNLTQLIDIINSSDNVELYLVGVAGQLGHKKIGNVHYVGNVSQMESFEYMENSDVLISIHDAKDYSQKYIISGKFYDYLKSNKLIMHIGAEDSLMSKLINQYELGITCPNQREMIEQQLEILIQMKNANHLIRKNNEKLVDFFDRNIQNERYYKILEKLVSKV